MRGILSNLEELARGILIGHFSLLLRLFFLSVDGNNDGDMLANDIALETGAVVLMQFAQIAAALLSDMEEEGLGDGHGKEKR